MTLKGAQAWRLALCALAVVSGLVSPGRKLYAAEAKPAVAEKPGVTPLPPAPKSPVDHFRELLAMSPAERRQSLTNRTPENQKLILAKIREYESLKPEQRELRLRVTELRWYLMPLMTSPATNRPSQLSMIPPDDRKLVEDRLREWDQLPAASQKQLLENEAAIRYFSELQSDTEEERRRILDSLSPARRAKLQAGIADWQRLPQAERDKLTGRFVQFFDLTGPEKAKAINTLSDAERQQIEKTLKNYTKLPPEQRAACIQSFRKFTSMSLEERQLFLKNAERWKLMSPSERESWRVLVKNLSDAPPLPGSLPPLPQPVRVPPRRPAIVVTNATPGR